MPGTEGRAALVTGIVGGVDEELRPSGVLRQERDPVVFQMLLVGGGGGIGNRALRGGGEGLRDFAGVLQFACNLVASGVDTNLIAEAVALADVEQGVDGPVGDGGAVLIENEDGLVAAGEIGIHIPRHGVGEVSGIGGVLTLQRAVGLEIGVRGFHGFHGAHIATVNQGSGLVEEVEVNAVAVGSRIIESEGLCDGVRSIVVA